MSRPKVAFLSDGYTEKFCIAEGETYPKVEGTFRPRTSLQALEYGHKAKALGENNEPGVARLTAEMVTEHIKTWNIVDEHGKDVVLCAANVERLSFSLIEELFKVITSEEMQRQQEGDGKN